MQGQSPQDSSYLAGSHNSPWQESHAKCGKRKWPFGHQYTAVVGADTALPQMHHPEYLVHSGEKANLSPCTLDILETVFLVSSPSLNTLISRQIYLLSLLLFFVFIPCEYECWGALFSACLVTKARTREITSLRQCSVFLLLVVDGFMMQIPNVASQTLPQKRTLQVHVTDWLKALSTSLENTLPLLLIFKLGVTINRKHRLHSAASIY